MKENQPQYPSFFEQIKNLSELAGKIPADLYNGKKILATEEKYDERLKVCFDCEHFVESDKRCKKCGCFVYAKARFEESACPILKW